MEADERYAASTKTYRETVVAQVFGTKLKDICGANGTEGPYPFPVKVRIRVSAP